MRFYVITYVTILACTTIEVQLPQTKASNLKRDRLAPTTRLRNLLELKNNAVLPLFKKFGQGKTPQGLSVLWHQLQEILGE